MTFTTAHSLAEAVAVAANGDVRILAGGTDVFASVASTGPALPILDVTRVPELQGIAQKDGQWRIGAGVTWAQVIAAPLPNAFDGLKAAAREVGSRQIQTTATLAGNLCNASPAADGVPPLLALDAQVEIQSRVGSRMVPLADFLIGPGQTCLQRGELVTAICLPTLPIGAVSGFTKLGARRYLVISIAMIAAVAVLDRAGAFQSLKLAIGACGPVARRQPKLEQLAIGQRAADIRVSVQDLQDLSPISDARATASYRLEAAAESATRVLQGLAT